jgi:hypothetical protein
MRRLRHSELVLLSQLAAAVGAALEADREPGDEIPPPNVEFLCALAARLDSLCSAIGADLPHDAMLELGRDVAAGAHSPTVMAKAERLLLRACEAQP